MDPLNTPQRKNFRCIFNSYVSEYNKDGVIQSIIAQFEGYFADPEVTVVNDGFIISLNVGDNLSPSMVRDKILWNQFIESVSVQDAIRKIQILRLPKASSEEGGTVGAFGPHGSDSGVDEIMIANGGPIPHMEYKIDDADRPDGPPFKVLTFKKHADPTGQMLPEIYGPGAEDGEPVDEDVNSDLTDLDTRNMPKVMMGFKVLSFDSDTGGSFTLNSPNGFQSVEQAPEGAAQQQVADAATGIGGGAPISGASWYVTQPGNEQGTDLGTERNRSYDLQSSAAPFAGIPSNATPSLVRAAGTEEEEDEQGIKGPYGATLDVLGVGEDPLGGASYGSFFGINETYGYEGDLDVNDF